MNYQNKNYKNRLYIFQYRFIFKQKEFKKLGKKSKKKIKMGSKIPEGYSKILSVKRKITYYLHKNKLERLYNRVCSRHEGDLYIWLMFDRNRGKLRNLEKEINGCGACIPQF